VTGLARRARVSRRADIAIGIVARQLALRGRALGGVVFLDVADLAARAALLAVVSAIIRAGRGAAIVRVSHATVRSGLQQVCYGINDRRAVLVTWSAESGTRKIRILFLPCKKKKEQNNQSHRVNVTSGILSLEKKKQTKKKKKKKEKKTKQTNKTTYGQIPVASS
jgi:hypothetical protein